jgi:hypothetical protein
MMTDSEFEVAVRQALQSKNDALLEDAIYRSALFCFKEGTPESTTPFSEERLSFLTSLFQEELFLRSESAYKLVTLLEYDWGRLSASQKERVIPVLEHLFEQIDHPTVLFVIAELFGEYHHDRNAYEALKRLQASGDSTHRAAVATGYERMSAYAVDPVLRHLAIESLEALASDQSDEVRAESRDLLTKALARKHGPR